MDIPPAFSVEYVSYYEDRHHRIADLKAQVADDLANHERYTAQQKQVISAYEQASRLHEDSLDFNNSLRAKIDSYRDVISKLTSIPGSNPKLPPKQVIIYTTYTTYKYT